MKRIGLLGGLRSADCLLRSVDFAEIELLVLCTNTMHKVAGAITASSCQASRTAGSSTR